MDLTTDAIQLLLNTGRGMTGIANPTNVPLLPFAVLPKPGGCEIVSVPSSLYVDPVSILKTIPVYDADSFVEYFKKYSNPNSRIFVDLHNRLITAVLDYHEVKSSDAPNPVARRGTHILTHTFRHTRKWEAWSAKNSATDAITFGQESFADFMEERIEDVVAADQSAIRAMCDGIYATQSAAFANMKRTPGGTTSLSFTEEAGAKAAGDVPIPNRFTIKLAPFEGTDEVSVSCLLRVQIDKNVKPPIKLSYRMLNIAEIMDNAVREVFLKISPQIQTHSFTMGTP